MIFGINGFGVNSGFTYFDIKTSSDSKVFKNEELVGYLTNHGFENGLNYGIYLLYEYNNYEFENDHAEWMPSLEHFIKSKPYGIVLCSLYSMTDDNDRREELFKLALDNGVQLHFANEYLSLKNEEDMQRIQTYLNFAVKKKDNYVWEVE